jgi:hypothetical protein
VPSPTPPPTPRAGLRALERAADTFSSSFALPSLIAGVAAGETSGEEAAAVLSRAVTAHAEARWELELTEYPEGLYGSVRSAVDWYSASLGDVLAVQAWLRAVRAGSDGDRYLAEHRDAKERARLAEAEFRRNLALARRAARS